LSKKLKASKSCTPVR